MGMDSYYYPKGAKETTENMNKIWNQLTNNALGSTRMIDVAQGRFITCNKHDKLVGEFTFKELCEDNRGSSDYMALAEFYQTLIIRGVP